MRLAATLLAVIACFVSTAQAAEVELKLDSDTVNIGEYTVLTLEIKGEVADRPQFLEVENLIIEPQGQSRQIEIVNGLSSTSVSFTYAVGSQVAGDYQIPVIEMLIDGQTYTSQALNLRVTDPGAAQPPAGAVPPPSNPQSPEVEAEAEEKKFGFLTVELADTERTHAYVGEIAPVRIRAWLPAGAQANLRSGIQPEGKGFTLHNVSSQPQQTRETRDGKSYTVVTWFGGISATKAGKLPASLSVNATVAVRDTAAPKPKRRRMGGPFDDPFFDSAFDSMNTPTVQKDVTLKSENQEIEVRALPLDGRPTGFTGAVGDFKFDSAEIPRSWKTGEPQQIIARFSGSGNFALMKAPALTPASGWKTYAGKDEFNGGDQASFSGNKVFQFSAVPRKGGEQTAALEFSYFDPIAEIYKTIEYPFGKIQVTGDDLAEDKPSDTLDSKVPEKKVQMLAALEEKLSARGVLVPLVSRRAFGEIFGVAGVMCASGLFLGGRRIRRENPERRGREQLASATREAVQAASAAEDVASFFLAAKLAIQQQLGVAWNQPPQAITTAEISARMAGDSPVARFFHEADRYAYSRQDSGEILPQWRVLFEEALAAITPSNR